MIVELELYWVSASNKSFIEHKTVKSIREFLPQTKIFNPI